MELTVLREVIEVLSGERRLFHYFPDRYALMLLSDYIGNRTVSIAELKQSPYARLLNRPLVKKALASAGNGRLDASYLNLIWDEQALSFVVTLDQWGYGKIDRAWNQMSRTGYHLVLQLNMATDHTQKFQSLVCPEEANLFNRYGHPVRQDGIRETLAWVRLDLDFDTNEALIEEIQSDWVRDAHVAAKGEEYYWYGECGPEKLKEYVNVVLAPYMKVWEEAMLAATISFIRHELGIDTVYYHSFEAGALLKNIGNELPPRSLYTQLPKRFAFQKTATGPEFLMRERRVQKIFKRVKEPYWFTLPKAA